jgi:uncharacterized membrane protein YbhN (UPF0104 family)
MLKKLNLFLIYSPLLFIFYFLWKTDFSTWPPIISYSHLLSGFVLLLPSYLFQLLSWSVTVQTETNTLDFKLIFKTGTQTILTKYIPGKVMSILGRASLLAEKSSISVKKLGQLSLFQQLLTLFVGGFWGSFFGYFVLNPMVALIIQTIWLFGLLILFKANSILSTTKIYFLNKIHLPTTQLDLSYYIKVSMYLILQWSFSGFAFYLFTGAFFPDEQQLSMLFLYPLAVNISMVIFFIPGGLGIREGILIFFLKLIGFPILEATALAFAYRLANLCFETILFLSSYWIKLPR